MALQVKNLPRIHEDAGLIPGLTQGVKDLALLWLWCRLASVAQIRPLAWKRPYAVGAALKRQKEKISQIPGIQASMGLLEVLSRGEKKWNLLPAKMVYFFLVSSLSLQPIWKQFLCLHHAPSLLPLSLSRVAQSWGQPGVQAH